MMPFPLYWMQLNKEMKNTIQHEWASRKSLIINSQELRWTNWFDACHNEQPTAWKGFKSLFFLYIAWTYLIKCLFLCKNRTIKALFKLFIQMNEESNRVIERMADNKPHNLNTQIHFLFYKSFYTDLS